MLFCVCSSVDLAVNPLDALGGAEEGILRASFPQGGQPPMAADESGL